MSVTNVFVEVMKLLLYILSLLFGDVWSVERLVVFVVGFVVCETSFVGSFVCSRSAVV